MIVDVTDLVLLGPRVGSDWGMTSLNLLSEQLIEGEFGLVEITCVDA